MKDMHVIPCKIFLKICGGGVDTADFFLTIRSSGLSSTIRASDVIFFAFNESFSSCILSLIFLLLRCRSVTSSIEVHPSEKTLVALLSTSTYPLMFSLVASGLVLHPGIDHQPIYLGYRRFLRITYSWRIIDDWTVFSFSACSNLISQTNSATDYSFAREDTSSHDPSSALWRRRNFFALFPALWHFLDPRLCTRW